MFLTSVTETYRVNSETEVELMLAEARKAPEYELKKYNIEKKERKESGEVVDRWFRVTMVKLFANEKDPQEEVGIRYEVG